MTDAGFIATGYLAAAAAIGSYVWRTLRRGRALSQRVPEGKRRWT